MWDKKEWRVRDIERELEIARKMEMVREKKIERVRETEIADGSWRQRDTKIYKKNEKIVTPA
jgi:hypothetical protein